MVVAVAVGMFLAAEAAVEGPAAYFAVADMTVLVTTTASNLFAFMTNRSSASKDFVSGAFLPVVFKVTAADHRSSASPDRRECRLLVVVVLV